MNLPIPHDDMEQSVQDATGQLGRRSKRIYEHDARAFAQWLIAQGLTVKDVNRSRMIAYRSYLEGNYAKATAARMLSVARRILDEQVISGNIPANPAKEVKGFQLGNESTHKSLTKQQAKELLEQINTQKPKGKLHFAIVYLLLRTGIRRTECVELNLGHISQQQGHTIITVKHGKGDKRRIVKIPPEVLRAINDYLEATNRKHDSPDMPLFVNIHARWKGQRITDKFVERVVEKYGEKIGFHRVEENALTPHDLRATFITLAIEGGASLHQAQYAAGHSDPRTTERYHTRKLNLDDNAVDYIKL